ncbi:MAG: hypothetical protein JSS56_01345 [Proteobacteria bacterium]|nr:hypothetical protein [Pseudomonadota bacterium]
MEELLVFAGASVGVAALLGVFAVFGRDKVGAFLQHRVQNAYLKREALDKRHAERDAKAEDSPHPVL